MNITEILIPAQEVAWLPWAVQYFFYIGASYAAAILFLVALVFSRQTTHHFRAALALTMAIGAIVGPLALTGDLHQPGRAWHFYFHVTPWSWMSLGSFFLPLFSGLSVLTAWLYLRRDIAAWQFSESPLLRKVALLTLGQWQSTPKQLLMAASLTALSGLSIAIYTGAEISVIASRPLWHQPASALLWFTSAFVGAIGFTLLTWTLLPNATKPALSCADRNIIQRTSVIAATLALVLVPIWASNNPSFSLFADPVWLINLTLMAASLLVCIGLALLFGVLATREFGVIAMLVCSLLCAWIIRWVTILEVQTIARFDVGDFAYQLPAGSAGWLGIIGIFGLWLALALIASELINTKATAARQPQAPQQ